MVLDKPLEAITEADLQSLRTNAVREDKTLDYKRLVGTSKTARREFLKDLSALANASGGHILIGVDEGPPGIAGEFSGLAVEGIDAEILRLEALARTSIEPRLFGVAMRPVPVGDGTRSVLVIRVRKSLFGPHVVKHEGHWRFYSRTSAGTYELDVPEVRSAFLISETAAERIRDFRGERLAAIVADEAPVYVSGAAKIVLHLVPSSAFDREQRFDSPTLKAHADGRVLPIAGGGNHVRHNFDGYLMETAGEGEPLGYLQLFHSGAIEAVDASSLEPQGEEGIIPTGHIGPKLIEAARDYMDFLTRLDVVPPVYLMVSFLNIFRYKLAVRERFWGRGRVIDRDSLVMREEVIEDLETDAAVILRPVFDALWNAAGFERCLDYDAEGAYWYES